MQHKLGIIGAGRVGAAIARTAMTAGYDVAIAASGPASDIELLTELITPGATAMDAAGAAAHGDIVIVAVPLHKHHTVDPELLRGKTVVDTMNYWEPIDGEIAEFSGAERGSSEIVGDHFAGSLVVKTLNHIGYHDLEIDAREPGHPGRRALGIAGDDPQAVAAIAEMIERFGFDAVPTGPLATGRALQPGTPIFGGYHSATDLRAEASRHESAPRVAA